MSIKNRIENLSVATRSIGLSFLGHFSASVIGFIMVPLLLTYLSKDNYGLWVTLISLVGWIMVSDFGIGYGFRNRVTEYLADGDQNKLDRHFVTTFQYYLIITIILVAVFIVVLFTNPILRNYKLLSLIIYVPYLIYFPFSISNQILQGLRFVHSTNLLNLVRSVLWAAMVYSAINWSSKNNLLTISIGYSLINSLICFITVRLAIKKSSIELPPWKALLKKPTFDENILTGIKFFVLQICSLLLFSMGNYFVYSNLTPTDTANYDTINKIYSLLMAFFNIVIAVYWSEITLLKSKGDFHQLNTVYTKLLLISVLFGFCSFAVAYIAPYFVSYWTNGKITITSLQCLTFSFLVSVQAIAYSAAVFLNAFEKVMPQVIVAIASIFLVYPLVKIGFQYQLGIVTIPVVSGILVIPSLIICHYVALRLINPGKF
jgi:O-antigen/teichoic acid export membrane protein